MVFLRGCATGLLLTDAAAPPLRVTQDVDVITEAASLRDYQRMSRRLRDRGFREDQRPDAPICRWVAADVVLDVMPTGPEVLGFGNEWHRPAFNSAMAFVLPSGKSIRMVTAPYDPHDRAIAGDAARCFRGNVRAVVEVGKVLGIVGDRSPAMQQRIYPFLYYLSAFLQNHLKYR